MGRRRGMPAQGREGRRGREKERIFPILIIFLKACFHKFNPQTKDMQGPAWCNNPNKILLGFIIIIRLGVLEIGRVLAKRNRKERQHPNLASDRERKNSTRNSGRYTRPRARIDAWWAMARGKGLEDG
jgi:hypothetical protein